MRATFIRSAETAVSLLARPELEGAWEQPSALQELTCAGLAGHLSRAIATVAIYLDEPGPRAAELDAVGYYVTAAAGPDLSAPVNVAVRARSLEAAAPGPAAVARSAGELVAELTRRLAVEPADRNLAVIAGRAISLDEYLRTRITELVVHSDDLALSLSLEHAGLDPGACAIAIDLLVAVARARHGEVAVLRALSRRERDVVQALRVF